MIDWHGYRTWAETNGRPCLVVPQGLQGIGSEKWKDDGYHYVGRRKIAPFMVIQRFSGWDVLVRYAERNNIHRFERRRWNILVRVQRCYAQRDLLAQEMRSKFWSPKGREVSIVATDANDGWFNVRIDKNLVWLDPMRQIDESRILDELVARTSGTAEASRLANRFVLLEYRAQKYNIKAQRFEAAMISILRELHPDRVRPWGRSPVEFIINGRSYTYSLNDTRQSQIEHWPIPTRVSINLDDEVTRA